MPSFAHEQLNPNIQAYFVKKLSPKVQLALRAYASGAVRTKYEAAEIAGITKEYFSLLASNPLVIDWMEQFAEKLDAAVVDRSVLIERLTRKALTVMDSLMDSPNDNIALKAATDILDRDPVTSKTQKLQVESFTLSGKDAKGIADALVGGTRIAEMFPEARSGNYDKVGMIPAETTNEPSV